MRIERLNENQIRCTLNKSDLEQRHLRLSELAKGSTKAREALHEMIQQAAIELGFEVENIPLMVEAIPISNESLVLVITRIDDPNKLEDKLSLLSKLAGIMKNELQEAIESLDESEQSDDFDDIFDEDDDGFRQGPISSIPPEFLKDEDLFDDLDGNLDPLGILAPFTQALTEAKQDKDKVQEENRNRIQLYTFESLDQVIRVSAFLTPFYEGESVLYKEKDSSCYYLFLNQNETSADHFRRACMIASEFGVRTPVNYAASAYCMEHCTLMIEGNALEVLNKLNC